MRHDVIHLSFGADSGTSRTRSLPRDAVHVSFGTDANGFPTERILLGTQLVELHYVDLPESDRTTVDGVPCTTALRTVIDMATQYTPWELDEAIHSFLERGLFTVSDALARIAEPDLADHPGAALLGKALHDSWLPGR